MTKISILLFAALGCAALAVSCSEDPESDTLAGSIYMIDHKFVSEVTYDGKPLVFDERKNTSTAQGESDTTIGMKLYLIAPDKTIHILLRHIPLSGKPFDVAFDCICKGATVTINDTRDQDAEVAVRGWIKCKDETYLSTRLSPALRNYAFEISLQCMHDGKLLTMKIKTSNMNKKHAGRYFLHAING